MIYIPTSYGDLISMQIIRLKALGKAYEAHKLEQRYNEHIRIHKEAKTA